MSRTVDGVEPTPSMILYTRPSVASKPEGLPGPTIIWVLMMLGGLVLLGRSTAKTQPQPLESQVADLAARVRSLESEVQALAPAPPIIRIAGD